MVSTPKVKDDAGEDPQSVCLCRDHREWGLHQKHRPFPVSTTTSSYRAPYLMLHLIQRYPLCSLFCWVYPPGRSARILHTAEPKPCNCQLLSTTSLFSSPICPQGLVLVLQPPTQRYLFPLPFSFLWASCDSFTKSPFSSLFLLPSP